MELIIAGLGIAACVIVVVIAAIVSVTDDE